jgi:hypothetical protein
MAEHDNAGFPLSYCLLTTATAVEIGKRKKALAAWGACVRDKYGVNPTFMHVDKDIGEIGALKTVWKESKISLCWWHLRRSVRTRLAKAKLATTPYNVKRACEEFNFIDADFIPPGTKVDLEDYEGGLPEDGPGIRVPVKEKPQIAPSSALREGLGDATNLLRIRLPPPSQPIRAPSTHKYQKENTNPADSHRDDRPRVQGTGFTLSLKPPNDPNDTSSGKQNAEEDSEGISEEDSNEKHARRTFCPPEHRQSIVDMLERHYCAHPSIPGYAAPNPVAIKRWAVQQMYGFCIRNEIPEVWAYLWENWYREGRWNLWARSAHKLIPVLKMTMILESQ